MHARRREELYFSSAPSAIQPKKIPYARSFPTSPAKPTAKAVMVADPDRHRAQPERPCCASTWSAPPTRSGDGRPGEPEQPDPLPRSAALAVAAGRILVTTIRPEDGTGRRRSHHGWTFADGHAMAMENWLTSQGCCVTTTLAPACSIDSRRGQ